MFSAYRGRGYSNIWVMDADGSHRRKLTSTYGNDWYPSYSPDGKRIVFERIHGAGDISVAVMNVDGTDLRDLTTKPEDDFSGWPDFSPDGTQIVYTRWRDYKAGIWLMNADGSHQHELTPRGARFDLGPSFSPSGRKVVFQNGTERHEGLYVMRADGSHIRRLPNSSPRDAVPDWGPRM